MSSEVFSDPLMKSDGQSRKLNESCVSLGECRSIFASTEIVEHTGPASLADPVQQDPSVFLVPSHQYVLDLARGYDRYPSMHVPLGAVPPLQRYQ